MVSDVDRRRHDELLRGIEAVARQPAALVADEAAALRIVHVVAQAPLLQPEGVGQGVVAAHVLDEHRMDPRRLVEVPARRQPPVDERLRVHADGADPPAVGRPLGGFGDSADEVPDRRHARIAHVDGGELGAGEGEVVMSIDEAGHDRAAGNVNSPAVRWGGGQGGVVIADGDDPVADDRDRARERELPGTGREHPPVDEHQPVVRMHRLSSLSPKSHPLFPLPPRITMHRS